MTSDDAEPTVPNPATADSTAATPTTPEPSAGPAHAAPASPSQQSPAGSSPLSALTPPPLGAGAMPLRTPGSDAAYRQTNGGQPTGGSLPAGGGLPANGGRSTTQRSFGQPEPQEPRFTPLYPGQAWPTEQPRYRPAYIPPPPADWHVQQARSYTSEPPKVNRVVAIAALVALIIGVLAGAGAATAVVALGGGGNAPIANQPDPPVGTGADPKIRTGSVSAVAATLLPSVVQLKVDGSDNSEATGSGFVLDNGRATTSPTTTSSPTPSPTTARSRSRPERRQVRRRPVVGRSPTYDLAVLYVKGGPRLPPASLGTARTWRSATRSSPSARRSASARTVTSGIVSALNRPVTTSETGSNASSYINARADRRGDQPGQLRRPAGRPARTGGRRELRDRDDRQQRRRARAGTSGSGSRSRSTRPGVPRSS